jgi:agmatine/peptidylarginine deiminase
MADLSLIDNDHDYVYPAEWTEQETVWLAWPTFETVQGFQI